MIKKESTQVLELVNEKFTPAEAGDLLNSLLDAYVNLQNIQMMRRWESNHQFDTRPLLQKIAGLKERKGTATALLADARAQRTTVKVSVCLEVQVTQNHWVKEAGTALSYN